jgi:hypothetical protein
LNIIVVFILEIKSIYAECFMKLNVYSFQGMADMQIATAGRSGTSTSKDFHNKNSKIGILSTCYAISAQSTECKQQQKFQKEGCKARKMRWAGNVAYMGNMRNSYKILVSKPEEKRPVGRHRHRWKDNIKMDLKEMRLEDVESIYLAWGRDQWEALVNMAFNFWVP